MAVDFQISIGSTVPIYRQIIDGVRRGVTNGELAVGDQLPSVRALAERLVVNHNTVAKAYQALVRDGVVETELARFPAVEVSTGSAVEVLLRGGHRFSFELERRSALLQRLRDLERSGGDETL